jgi:hypothetical protein
MLRKTSIGAMAVLAVSMSSVAFAQSEWSADRHWTGAEWNPTMSKDWSHRYPGNAGTVWSHAMMTLNASELVTLKDMFRHLPGSDEQVIMKGIANAMEKNSETYMTSWQRGEFTGMTAGSNMNQGSTTGTANQPMVGTGLGMGMYPREWELRPVRPMVAYETFVGGLDESERGVVRRVWPTLQSREQDAILKLIMESPRAHAMIMRYESWNRSSMVRSGG